MDWISEEPLSRTYKDLYFSKKRATQEANFVFIQGNDLQQRWSNLKRNEVFNIVELGFGAGINFLTTLKTWTEIYIYETDRLAMHLYVPNYRNPAQARYRFNREGAEFIQALPGPADVAVGTRLLLEVSHR